MSHQTKRSQRLVKSALGVVGVTVTVMLFVISGSNPHAKSSASPNDRTAVPTEASDPIDVVWGITNNAGVEAHAHAPDVTSEATADAGDITASDGFIAADVTLSPFDVDQPAVGNLNRDLLDAIQQATTDAATDGIAIRINSGWRSARYQQQLLNQAVIKYGSEQEARKWVDTPQQSSHVAGNAVDIAPTAADDWLLRHGNKYGLCQIYANEIWHFELATQPGGQCPRPKVDASDG